MINFTVLSPNNRYQNNGYVGVGYQETSNQGYNNGNSSYNQNYSAKNSYRQGGANNGNDYGN